MKFSEKNKTFDLTCLFTEADFKTFSTPLIATPSSCVCVAPYIHSRPG